MNRNLKKENADPVSSEERSPAPAAPAKNSPGAEAIQDWLVNKLVEILEIEPDEIDSREPFAGYGLSSVQAVILSGELEEWLGRRLSPTLAYEYPTIEALAQHLAQEPDVSINVGPVGKAEVEPIAIIGLSCRFPGAENPAAFWRLLRDGVDAITEVPSDRWDIDAFYDSNPLAPSKMNTRWGGFLERVDQFDPHFFGTSPREAARMDPQQRLLLELAWEALEDAGQSPELLAGSRTGVFIGIASADYGRIQMNPAFSDAYMGTGCAASIAANRISYVFNFNGPSLITDTACSSSLVATHLACRSLWSGESTMALVGGVNIILSPTITINFCKAGMLSPEGRCKAFDAKANGFVRGEGAGVVVLKTLAKARADGDPIYAVIRGSAVNSDGRTNGLTAPNRNAQQEAMLEACRRAGVSPGQIAYIEAHGTGTALGDPIEATALGTVLAIGRPPERPCAIGSVKTNIGHLEAAAGMAGLIKVALMLKHRAIPPSLHFQEPNPHIPFDELPLRVQTTLSPWPRQADPPLAGINSLGFGGTNAHVILEGVSEGSQRLQDDESPSSIQSSRTPYLLPLSARSPEALQALARAYKDFLTAEGSRSVVSLPSLCYTASVRRSHQDYRLALVAHSREELTEHLDAFLNGETRPGTSTGRRPADHRQKLVFVCSGQGPQWWAMGRELLEQEPVFRATIENCDELFCVYTGRSLLKELTADESRSRLDETEIAQPSLFALQVALAALWRSWGIVPDAVVGHSVGEVSAAHIAGALSLPDAVRLAFHRGRLMQQATGLGRMLAVDLSWAEAAHALAGYEDRVSIAAHNSPTATTLSGEQAALEEIVRVLQQREIFFRFLPVKYAFHSPQMEPFRRELEAALIGLEPQRASVPIFSTVTGEAIDGRELDASYWGRNLRESVLFASAIDKVAEDGHTMFLELSPHPVLSGSISQCLRQRGQEGLVLASLRRGEEEHAVMLGALGALHTRGYPVDWSRLYPSGGECVQLPSYPWQRESCWLQVTETDIWQHTSPDSSATGRHPLLGRHLKLAPLSGDDVWEIELDGRSLPYLDDHRIQGTMLLPAAAYVEMALAASSATNSGGLKEIEFQRALVIPENGEQTVQVILSSDAGGGHSFYIYSHSGGAEESQESWVLHALGRVQHDAADNVPEALPQAAPRDIQAQGLEEVSVQDYYQGLRERGLEYGSCFQGIARLWRRDGESLGQIRVPAEIEPEAGAYRIHPAILDACFQVLAGAMPVEVIEDGHRSPFLPVAIDRVRVYGRPGSELWSHARLRTKVEGTTSLVEGDVLLLDETGRGIAEIQGLRLQRLDRGAHHIASEDLNDWLYEVQWQPWERPAQDRPLERSSSEQSGTWIFFDNSSGVGERLASLLEANGQTCVVVYPGETYKSLAPGHYQLNPACPEDFRRLLGDNSGDGRPPCRAVVYLWGLDAAAPAELTPASLEAGQTLGCGGVLHLIQGLAGAGWAESPRLWLVTSGAQSVGAGADSVAVAQAPLWGLGRVIAREHPELRCTNVDLSHARPSRELQLLWQEFGAGDAEDQLALRGDMRYVARLVRVSSPAAQEAAPEETLPDARRLVPPANLPFRLEVSSPGVLDSLTLRPATRREPGPGQVEIEVCASGLNFVDVMKALGIAPGVSDAGVSLGAECAGRIAAVGEGIEDFKVGDEVIAVAPYSFGSFTTTHVSLVVPKPARISFQEAATIPITFITAYYALHHIGRLSRGERVLIHAASGGVGLAAVQLARYFGAEIYGTAGRPDKREYLHSLGIEHVMDSRSLAFADEVLEHTGGQGVDVVLNSLAGEAIPKSISILRPYGRFLEIGKRDIYQNSQLGLRPFQKNLSFSAIDVDRMCRERPAVVGSLFREVMRLFEDDVLKPLPFRAFPASESVGAFRTMAQAKHIGKIVISLQEQAGSAVESSSATRETLRSDGTYLVTGGLGDLGLTVAQWMVRQGARHLVLVGRGGPSAEAEQALDAMRNGGAQVVVARADVAQESQVAGLLHEIEQSLPPLRGVIHAAGILDDGMLLQMDRERLASVLKPKIDGAWNLHALTSNKQLDLFVLFSSAASVLGSPGQGAYAAANAFMDGLAHYRQAEGLPALSINWGPWARVGMAARSDRAGRFAAPGFSGLEPEQGLNILGRLLRRGQAQVAVMRIDWQKWHQLYPGLGQLPLLSQMIREEGIDAPRAGHAKAGRLRATVLASEPEERQRLLEDYLRGEVARALGLPPSKLDVHEPLNNVGIDSLMSLELKNRIEVDLGVSIPMVKFLEEPSLSQLAAQVLNQLPTADPAESHILSQERGAEQPAQQEVNDLLLRLDQLSDQEVDALLREKLASQGGDQ